MLASIANASTACTQAGLDFYIANYMAGCTIGDKLFSNWFYDGGGISNASDVTVTPIPGPNGGNTDPGIQFSTGAWQAFPGQTNDFVLSYTVAAPPGMLIDDAGLAITGGIAGPPGSGVGTVNEHLNNPVIDISGSPLVAAVPSPDHAHLDFSSPVQSLNVVNNIHLQSTLGHPTISAINEDFSQIQSAPEPVGTLLIGSGILVFGLKWRKRSGQ
jgi:hypothetical protein